MELVSNDLVTMDEDVEADDIFSIDVSGYEGPLHLLLDLARKQKVDLFASQLHAARQGRHADALFGQPREGQFG